MHCTPFFTTFAASIFVAYRAFDVVSQRVGASGGPRVHIAREHVNTCALMALQCTKPYYFDERCEGELRRALRRVCMRVSVRLEVVYSAGLRIACNSSMSCARPHLMRRRIRSILDSPGARRPRASRAGGRLQLSSAVHAAVGSTASASPRGCYLLGYDLL